MPRVFCLVLGVAFAAQVAAQAGEIVADPDRMERRILQLGEFGANPEGGVSRIAYSKADLQGRDYIRGLMEQAGLSVHTDAAGNLIGRREGTDSALPAIMFGSHIDSVPGGGNYDGDVGVIAAIEVAQLLSKHQIETRHPIEVISFTDEEGGLVGSRAMIGTLGDSALDVISHSGLTVRDGIREVGGDPDRLAEVVRRPGDLAAFIEVHIEQGAILDSEGIDIGVVEGIVGIRWWDITIEGFANHAGTTPMDRRQDALLSAAELVVAINRVATTLDGRQVATVGRIEAHPGAPNVIPGRATMSLEIRDLDAGKMQAVFDAIELEARRIEEQRKTPVYFEELDVASLPAPTDERVRRIIDQAARGRGLSTLTMPSGAGHDAQDMAKIAPTGMIFVPSRGGISHSPREYTSAEAMANGANVLLDTILAIDRRGLNQP